MNKAANDWASRVLQHVAAETTTRSETDELRALAQGDLAREAELAWLDGLARYVDMPTASSPSSQALVERALAAVDQPPPTRALIRRPLVVAGLSSLAVAAGLSWFWLRGVGSMSPEERSGWPVDVAADTVARLDGQPLAGDARIPPGGRLDVAKGHACVLVADATVCAREDASLLRAEGAQAEGHLASWRGEVSIAWRHESSSPIVFDDLTLRAHDGPAEVVLEAGSPERGPQATIVRGVLEFAVAGKTWTAVEGETVTWRSPNATPTDVTDVAWRSPNATPTNVTDVAADDEAGPAGIDEGDTEETDAALDLGRAEGSPDTKAKIPPADELLTAAQGHRRAGRWKAAARTYRELTRLHPGTDAARVGRVAWADLQLDKLGQLRGAIRNYRRYLDEGGGPLSAEVHANLARAYREVGDVDRERAELEALLRDARGTRADALRRRLADLP